MVVDHCLDDVIMLQSDWLISRLLFYAIMTAQKGIPEQFPFILVSTYEIRVQAKLQI